MKKTKIEYCDSTWNPVSGCMHECAYCYARRIATRFGGPQKFANIFELDEPVRGEDGKAKAYPYSFCPTFHRYKLGELVRWAKPRTVFVCSMADLFGQWVPDSWVTEVFDACSKAPQHRYLFLTKNPARYLGLEKKGFLPHKDNMWYGTSVTEPNMPYAYFSAKSGIRWFLSIEPLMADMGKFGNPEKPGWIVTGAETGNRDGKVAPKKEWAEGLAAECSRLGIPLFMKESLVPVIGEENMRRELPWGGGK